MASRSPKRERTGATSSVPYTGGSFVGREHELDEIAVRFDDSRLVSIVGPGGIGKTRLALEFTRLSAAVYARPERGGVWFVDLTESANETEALGAAAFALGAVLRDRSSPREMLASLSKHITNLGPCLVILDNAEHLAPAVAQWLARLFVAAPSARFVVTSRVVLGLDGERELTLGPLDARAACALFVDRMKAVRAVSDHELDPATIRARTRCSRARARVRR